MFECAGNTRSDEFIDDSNASLSSLATERCALYYWSDFKRYTISLPRVVKEGSVEIDPSHGLPHPTAGANTLALEGGCPCLDEGAHTHTTDKRSDSSLCRCWVQGTSLLPFRHSIHTSRACLISHPVHGHAAVKRLSYRFNPLEVRYSYRNTKKSCEQCRSSLPTSLFSEERTLPPSLTGKAAQCHLANCIEEVLQICS